MPILLSPSPFTYAVQPDRESVVLSLSGELDLAAAPQARQALDELVPVGFSKVVVDLRDLAFMDSEGLRVLLEAAASAKEHGCELSLIPGPANVQRIFEVTACASVFTFEKARLAR